MRAPLLIEQVLEETMAAIRRDSVGMSSRERNLVADVQRSLLSNRPLLVREFVRALTEQVQHDIDDVESTKRPAPSTLGGLSLVDESQVEVDVELSRVIEAIRSVAEHELRELMSFTSALVGDMDVARDYNPFRPDVIGRALWDAAQCLPSAARLPAVLHAPCLHAAGPAGAQVLRRRLFAAGIDGRRAGRLPHHHRLRQSPHAGAAGTAFFDPNANRVESSTPMPGPSGRPRIVDATAVAPTPEPGTPRLSLEQVLSRTDEMLRNLPADGDPRRREHLRNLQRQQMVYSAENSADRELIELMSRLFDAVLGDRRLALDMQNLVSRLQAPAPRLALRDPGHAGQLHPSRVAADGPCGAAGRPAPARRRPGAHAHAAFHARPDGHAGTGAGSRFRRLPRPRTGDDL